MYYYLIVAVIGLISTFSAEAAVYVKNKPIQHVLLISIDGFRHDYPQLHSATNIEKLAKNGVKVKQLSPAYPSLTFPNHVSLITGLYPAKHGIISNSFFNPELDKAYSIGNKDSVTDSEFYQGVPLWSLAGQQNMKSAAYFWVGSETEIAGHRPTYWLPYDGSKTLDERVNKVIDWLSLSDDKRPQFTTLYFSEVDSAGHEYGPKSPETYQAVQNVDSAIGDLMSRIKLLSTEKNIDINVILTSDHGMAKVDNHPRIFTDKLLDEHESLKNKFEFQGSGALTFIHATGSNKEQDLNELEAAVKDVEGLSFYRHQDIPAHLNFKDHPAIRDGIFMVHDHYLIASTQRPGPIGMHGYDPIQVPQMNTLMYATGPAFIKGAMVEQASVVDIYPMVAKILGLTITQPIDGQFSVLAPLVK